MNTMNHNHLSTTVISANALDQQLLALLAADENLARGPGAKPDSSPLAPAVAAPAPTLARNGGPLRLAQPLVLIGVGGTGRRILTFFKAALLNRLGAMPANVVLLAIDSGSETISVRDQQGRIVQLQRSSEYIPLENVPIANIKREPHYHPEMVERLGSALNQIRRANIIHGAASERMQGLAALYFYAPIVIGEIRRALRRVTEKSHSVDGEQSTVAGMNIVLVGSTAGGQGSGALLDIALLVQEGLSTLGDWADVTRMAGLFVLPSAFDGLDQRNSQLMIPNTYAFLRELDSLMSGAHLDLRYPGNVRVVSNDAPFDYVFAVEGIDERGYNWPSLDEVCQLAARSLALLLCGNVGLAELAYAVNKEGVLNRVTPNGFRTYLATLGLAELYYPAQQVAERCTLRMARQVIDHVLAPVVLDQPNNEGAEGDRPFTPPAIDCQRWQSQLRGDGIPETIQIRLPADIEEADPAQIPARVRGYATLFLQQRVYNTAWPILQASVRQLTAAMLDAYAGWREQLLATGHLRGALALLRTAQQMVAQHSTLLQRDQQTNNEEIQQKRRDLTAADIALGQAADSFWWGRQSRTLTATHRFLAESARLAELELQQRRLNLIAELLHQLDQWLAEQIRLAENGELRLQQMRDRLDSAEQKLTHLPVGQHVINLADEVLINELYQQHAQPPQLGLAATLRACQHSTDNSLLDWATQPADTMLQQLVQAISPTFAPLTTTSAEAILHQRWPDRPTDYWVGALEELAAGAWNVDRAKLPPGNTQLATYITIGVADAEHSIFAKSRYTCTSTGDPQRIIALRTIYGASVDALKAAPRWQRIYSAALATEPPLHILPAFDQNTDRALQLLGLALAFGYIQQNRTWFAYHPIDALDKPVQLGNGLHNALAYLTREQRLCATLQQRIDTHIATVGQSQARAQLASWVANGNDKEDELTTNIRRTVRAYVERLK